MTRSQRYRDERTGKSEAALWMPVSEPADELVKTAETTADKVLICQQCGKQFIFSAGEQRFYSQRELSQPRRCPECRAIQRGERNNSYRNTGPGYVAKCANCGKETTVPFEPREGRPIYCRDCYFTLKRNTRTSPVWVR